jgi:hypothetical protein
MTDFSEHMHRRSQKASQNTAGVDFGLGAQKRPALAPPKSRRRVGEPNKWAVRQDPIGSAGTPQQRQSDARGPLGSDTTAFPLVSPAKNFPPAKNTAVANVSIIFYALYLFYTNCFMFCLHFVAFLHFLELTY